MRKTLDQTTTPFAVLPDEGGAATRAVPITHADDGTRTTEDRTRGAEEATGGADDEATERAGRLPSGWYVLGLAVQVFLWFLVFFGIAVAIAVGGHLTEFRYVGF